MAKRKGEICSCLSSLVTIVMLVLSGLVMIDNFVVLRFLDQRQVVEVGDARVWQQINSYQVKQSILEHNITNLLKEVKELNQWKQRQQEQKRMATKSPTSVVSASIQTTTVPLTQKQANSQKLKAKRSGTKAGLTFGAKLLPPPSLYNQGQLGQGHENIKKKRTLVVYSGPTEILNATKMKDIPAEKWTNLDNKKMLYIKNTNYFIQHGIQCKSHDTAIVMTEAVAPLYRQELETLDKTCHEKYGHRVHLLIRNNVCYDMESVRVVFADASLDAASYDYLVYINCGTTGPSKDWTMDDNRPWIDHFVNLLDDRIKMTGLSMVCSTAHIQSMMYAVDRVGIDIIKTIPYECMKTPEIKANPNNRGKLLNHIINGYERRMGKSIMENGYGIKSILQPHLPVFQFNRTDCKEGDMWMEGRLQELFGKVPSLKETMFFKTSRVLTNEMAQEINYTGHVNWNWP